MSEADARDMVDEVGIADAVGMTDAVEAVIVSMAITLEAAWRSGLLVS
ncbi:hypothetical protein ACGF4C_24380 [Streptomyces sp. NPDC048197]